MLTYALTLIPSKNNLGNNSRSAPPNVEYLSLVQRLSAPIDEQMKRVVIILALALSFFSVPSKAEGVTGAEIKALATKRDERSERKFELWNNCKPMHLQVVVNIPALKIDKILTNADIHQMITRTISNRLLSAYLYKSDAIPFLQILVVRAGVYSNEYHVRTVYNKVLYDPASGIYRLVPAWQSNSTVGNADLRSGIVQDIDSKVSNRVDEFITAYQNVNADACAHRQN